MQQQDRSAYDEVGEDSFEHILDVIEDQQLRFEQSSADMISITIENNVHNHEIAKAALNEIAELSKRVDGETLIEILKSTISTASLVSPNVLTFLDSGIPKDDAFVKDYKLYLQECNKQFLIKNINRLAKPELIHVIVQGIRAGTISHDFIDVMKLDINAPQEFRHQHLRSDWNDVDDSAKEPLKIWNDIPKKNKCETLNALILKFVELRDWKTAAKYMEVLTKNTDSKDFNKNYLVFKYCLLTGIHNYRFGDLQKLLLSGSSEFRNDPLIRKLTTNDGIMLYFRDWRFEEIDYAALEDKTLSLILKTFHELQTAWNTSP